MSFYLSCTHPPSTANSSSHFGACQPTLSLVFLRSIAWLGSSHTPSFNPSHSSVAAQFFQQTTRACFRSISCHVLRADHSHVHRHLPLKKARCANVALMPKSRNLARDGSCRSSHLSPCLHFEDLFPPNLQVLFSPIFHHQSPSAQASVAMVVSFLNFQIMHFHEK